MDDIHRNFSEDDEYDSYIDGKNNIFLNCEYKNNT